MGRSLRLLAEQKARPGDMGTPGRTNKRPAEHRRPIERGGYEKPACSLAAFFRVRFANDQTTMLRALGYIVLLRTELL
jgi:hypothetical protein